MIFFLIWLPPLLTFFLFLASVGETLLNYNKSFSLCRYQLLQGQKRALVHLKILLRFNPKATKLRLQRKKDEKVLKIAQASLNPKLILTAQANLLKTLLLQKQLRSEQEFQKNIIKSHEKKLKSEYQHKFKKFLKKTANNLSIGSLKLAVRALPLVSITPNHYLANQFKEKQKITASWSLYGLSYLKNWNLEKFLKWNHHCSATIIKHSQKLEISLI